MANWFYIDNFGTKQGPVTEEALHNLVLQGIVTPQTQLESESGQQGLASQVNGLFPEQPYQQPPTAQPAPFSQPNYQQQPQFGQQQYQQPQYGQPAYPLPKPPKDYLIWSIITTLCCCLPLGIVGIIFSVQAKSAFQIGDYAGYESKTKVAFWCNLVGLMSGLLINGAITAIKITQDGNF